MAVLKWVFRNAALVLMAGAVALGVVYWDELEPELVAFGESIGLVAVRTNGAIQAGQGASQDPVGAEKTAPEIPKAADPKPASEKPADQKPAEQARVEEMTAAEQPDSQSQPESQPESQPQSTPQSKPAPAPVAEAPAADQPTPEQPAPAPAPQAEVAAPQAEVAAPQAEAVAPQAEAAKPQEEAGAPPAEQAQPVDALRRDWAAARTAYWQRDLEKAAALYTALAAAHPEQADVWGELGNVHMQMGARDKAGEAYLAAGQALLKGETPMAANRVIGPLNMVAPEKADALRKAIFDTAGN